MRTLSRRTVLRGTSAAIALAASTGYAAKGRLAVVGMGRIQDPIEGVTVPSPSDFGFAADEAGGTFVCSMFGPETGGFRGCNLMTVQGIVTPGTITIQRGVVSFSGKVDVFVFPDVFSDPPGPYLNAAANDFTVIAELGGPGKATMILKVPFATPAIGGDTGGIVRVGRIKRSRVR